MAVFTCRTRNDEDPDGKTKVYFSHAPDMERKILDEVAERLLEEHDYAIYEADADDEVDTAFLDQFAEMDKVAFFISDGMFSDVNRSLFYELPLSMLSEKDLMPVDDGTGRIDLFLTCCEHIPRNWSVSDAVPLIKRTLLMGFAEMAGVWQLKKEYGKAEIELLRAQRLSEEVSGLVRDDMSLDDESICLMNLGINRGFMDDAEGAYAYASKALQKTDELIAYDDSLASRKRKLYCLRVLGETARMMKDDEKQERWFGEAVRYAKELLEKTDDREVTETLPLALIRFAEVIDKKAWNDYAVDLYREGLESYKALQKKRTAPDYLLKDMTSSAIRLFQLLLEREDPSLVDEISEWQEYAGALMTRIGDLAKEAKMKEIRKHVPGTITLPD